MTRFFLKTVEEYDPYENKCTRLPDMIHSRLRHGAVSVGNKMFVVSGLVPNTRFGYNESEKLTCEVFDSISRIFTEIRQIKKPLKYLVIPLTAVSIGHKILVLKMFSTEIRVYDVVKDVWNLEEIVIDEIKSVFTCSKLPIV